jgi:hypothetical protein
MGTDDKGFGGYNVLIDGKLYSQGGLPSHIKGKKITWTLVGGTPNYSGLLPDQLSDNQTGGK